MSTLSRRSFLRLAGVTLATVPLSRFPMSLNDASPNQGRALLAAPIFQTQNLQSDVVGHLWPDSIVSLLDADHDWYQVPGGFVSRTSIQPMVSYSPNEQASDFNRPFWAEVAGPVASIRTSCAANAPLVTRVGHSGVLRVVDFLPGEPGGWYGVADEQRQFIGWTQAVFWREISASPNTQIIGERQFHINRETFQLTALENGEVVLQALCAICQTLPTGQYKVQEQQISGIWQGGVEVWQGVPWQTHFGEGYSVAGAYWHNRFGEALPGPAVQTTPVLARWLYGWLNDQTHIVVT